MAVVVLLCGQVRSQTASITGCLEVLGPVPGFFAWYAALSVVSEEMGGTDSIQDLRSEAIFKLYLNLLSQRILRKTVEGSTASGVSVAISRFRPGNRNPSLGFRRPIFVCLRGHPGTRRERRSRHCCVSETRTTNSLLDHAFV